MWRKLTEDDLVATLSRREVDGYKDDFEIDAVAVLLADTTAWARGYIRSNGEVRMDPDETTLPASCVSPAMDYAALKVLKRLNIEPKEVRKTAYKEAIAFFREVAERKIHPENFDEASADAEKMLATAPAFSAPTPKRLLD
jgi:hypothetical protein